MNWFWRKPRRVAILGGGPSWVRAPWKDRSWEIWSHSSCFEGMPRADRWFEVHRPDVRAGEKEWSPRYRDWVTGKPCPPFTVENEDGTKLERHERTRTSPIYILDNFPELKEGVEIIGNDEIPNHRVIPRAKIEAYLRKKGAVEQEYTSSTAVWMLKLAIYEGVREIGIWGISYDEHGEFVVQRPCMEYWVGFARALGVIVYITPTAALGRDPHVYGFDGPNKNLVHTRKAYNKAKARPLFVKEATGETVIQHVPPEIQELIDQEKQIFGIDTEKLWKDMARKR